MHPGIFWQGANRLPEISDGEAWAITLQCQQAQAMQCVGVIRQFRKDLTVPSLGIRETASLMIGGRTLKPSGKSP